MVTLKYKKLLAFSLVELMISLITISCIAAAFTPVITKKLKKQDVALSLAQTSEITNQCSGYEPKFTDKCKLCTKTYCIQCGLEMCADGQYVDSSYCGCKSCSENKTVVPDNCEDCKKCITCTKDKCTKCEIGYYLEGLNGVTHATCQKCGKTNGRNNYCFDGIKEQSPDYCDNPPGGYFCKGSNLKSCKEEYENQCNTCNASQCLTCVGGYFLNTSKKCQNCNLTACSVCTDNQTCTSCSADWLLDTTQHKCVKICQDVIANCRTCSGTANDLNNVKCTGCYGGYYVKDGKCLECKTISNCLYCMDNGKCFKCNNGYYVNSSGVCTPCNIANCSACSADGKCASCNQGYHLSEDNKSCIANNYGFNCSDANFMQIGKLCVTRKNMGDSTMLTIPPTISIAKFGTDFCASYSSKCCWQGTSRTDACDDINGGYSGCTRTLCNWRAAKEICASFNYGGKTWRLATKEEMAKWGEYSVGLGLNGLMLCDSYEGFNSARCADNYNCKGALNNVGWTNNVWSGSSYSNEKGAYTYYLLSAKWYGPGGQDAALALNVRCVTEMDE